MKSVKLKVLALSFVIIFANNKYLFGSEASSSREPQETRKKLPAPSLQALAARAAILRERVPYQERELLPTRTREFIEAVAELDEQLLKTTEEGQLDQVRKLIAEGADVNAQDINGSSTLMLAAGAGHEDIARELLANGAKVNATDIHGTTALMRAAKGRPSRDRRSIVKLLLSHGANATIKNRYNQSAQDLAPVGIRVIIKKHLKQEERRREQRMKRSQERQKKRMKLRRK